MCPLKDFKGLLSHKIATSILWLIINGKDPLLSNPKYCDQNSVSILLCMHTRKLWNNRQVHSNKELATSCNSNLFMTCGQICKFI